MEGTKQKRNIFSFIKNSYPAVFFKFFFVFFENSKMLTKQECLDSQKVTVL